MKIDQQQIFEEKFKLQISNILSPIEYADTNNIPSNEISNPDKLCQKPLVSIVCITYNHEKYIEKAFKGFEMQKCNFEFEVIIGEDCSTDNTLSLCKKFQKKHPNQVRLITSETNVGSIKNLIRIFFMARGKYIALCEGDDCWISQNKLQKQVDFLESNPDYNFIHTNAEVRYFNEEFISVYQNKSEIESLIKSTHPESDRLLLRWPVATATTLFRREHCLTLYKNNPQNIYTEIRRLGDIQLWTGLMSLGKMAYLPDVTACYHLSKESATRSKNKKRTFMLFCDAFEVYLKLNSIFNNNDQFVYHDIMRRTAQQALFRAYEVGEITLVKTANKLLRLYGERNIIITTSMLCSSIHAPFWVLHGILKFYTLCTKCRNVFISKKFKQS